MEETRKSNDEGERKKRSRRLKQTGEGNQDIAANREENTHSGELQFTNLMLLHTSPLYWTPRAATFFAKKMCDLLVLFLKPDDPGFAMLRIPNEGTEERQWIEGDQAVQWVVQAYESVWLPAGELLKQFGTSVAEAVFHSFVEHRPTLFVDKKRFLSVFESTVSAFGEIDERLRQKLSEESNLDYYVSLQIDWSYPRTLLWTPQLRISNYWPDSEQLAPPRPDSIANPQPMNAEQASHVLRTVFWEIVETALHTIRRQNSLGDAFVRISQNRYASPVFYYVEPFMMPNEPEHYFLDSDCRRALEHLGRNTLGTHDLRSLDVSGSFLEGSLVTLRREIRAAEAIQAYYLILPWCQERNKETAHESEHELMFIADKWSFVEFHAAFKAYDALTDIELRAHHISLWGGSVDDAAQIAQLIQRETVFETNIERKRKLFELSYQIRSTLANVESEMIRTTDSIFRTESSLKTAIENFVHFTNMVFTSRSLPEIRNLLETATDFFPLRYGKEVLQHASTRAKELRETFDAVESSIHDLLDQEVRADREREEKRREEELQQRNQQHQTLGLGLAAFAALAAFPLLIGQMGWAELEASTRKFPPFLSWLGNLLKVSHPYLVPFAIVVTVSLILLLISLSILIFLRSRRRRKSDEGSEPDDWFKTGVLIRDSWRLVHDAQPMIQQLRNVAFISRDVPEESEYVMEWRKQTDKRDAEICEKLLQVWNWLHESKVDEGMNMQISTDDPWFWKLERMVRRFAVLVELFDNRPSPFPLPIGLCLLRFKCTDFIRESIVSDYEFEQILNGYGYADVEVEQINDWGNKNRSLPASEFVQKLREELGVSALHDREIKSDQLQQREQIRSQIAEESGSEDLGDAETEILTRPKQLSQADDQQHSQTGEDDEQDIST